MERIGFFGSFTERRKICYLVDCSGSMRGVFRRVRKELKESIGNLQRDQYFHIIFFGGGRLIEFSNGRLLRVTEKAKFSACDFIDSVEPVEQTNALERGMQIRGSGWHCRQLCDGHAVGSSKGQAYEPALI